MANIYTKGGDQGQTSLIGGSRVDKSNLRVECYGTIDELTSFLGMAYAFSESIFVKTWIRKIQKTLFCYAAELAADPVGLEKLEGSLVSGKQIAELENMIDVCTAVNGLQTEFVIPGDNRSSAILHVSRTVARRAERHIVRLRGELLLREPVICYINRLSDAIYALARLEESFQQMKTEDAVMIDETLVELMESGNGIFGYLGMILKATG